MSYNIYNTKAIIIHRENVGESDIVFWIITEELGLITARAISVRKNTSKMRMLLQLYNVVNISLIRGRYVWRVVGVEDIFDENYGDIIGSGLDIFANISNLLRRLVIVNSCNNKKIFSVILELRTNIIHNSKQGIDLDKIEVITLVKILFELGYIDVALLKDIKNSEVGLDELRLIISNAIKESQL